MNELLEKLNACSEAREWAKDKNWNEVYSTCHRGDWLLWLFKKTNPTDLRLLTLAKGHCAKTVLHLMKDERSKKAVQSSIDFGNGIIEINELNTAAASASAASAASAADASAAAAAYAAASAAAAAYASASAAAAASADASASAKKENQKLTADIVRKYISIELWNI